MDTNGHEKNSESRMDTNGHEWLWAEEGRFPTLWRLRPVDFQAELEKLDRERERDEKSAGLEDLREIVDGNTP